MRKTKIFLAAAATCVALQTKAQWTTVGTNVYVTDTTKNVLVGTTQNNALSPGNLYVRKSNSAVTLGISSGTAGATMFMDKATATSNAAFAYRLLGTNLWNSGMLGNNNFTIRNVTLATNPFVITQADKVGIGTGAPVNKLSVVGSVDFSGNVGVGISGGFGGKLHVVEGAAASDTLPVILARTNYTGTAKDVVGVYGDAATNTAAGWGIGVEGDGNYIGTAGFGGVYGSYNVGGETGVHGQAAGSTDTTTATGFISTGVQAIAGPGNESTGIYAEAGGGQFNYGIIGLCGPNYSPADSDNTHRNWAAFFYGDIIYSRAYRWSDAKLKNDIKPIESALEKLSRVQTSTYTFKTKEFAQLDLPAGRQIGFVAENMETVFPDLVKVSRSPRIVTGRDHKVARESVTFKAVNYEGILPVVVAAINEQSQKVNIAEAEMTARIAQLESEVAALKNMIAGRNTNITVTNSLMQNVPNPFNQATQINYQLASDAKNASIVIRGLNGEELKSITLSNTGKGQVTINANELAQGTYTYTLIVNGKSVDTKLMVVTK